MIVFLRNIPGDTSRRDIMDFVTPALRAIKKLHGGVFKGKRIVVREYAVRSWKNDRRIVPGKPVEPALERRSTPTRRRILHIEMRRLPGG